MNDFHFRSEGWADGLIDCPTFPLSRRHSEQRSNSKVSIVSVTMANRSCERSLFPRLLVVQIAKNKKQDSVYRNTFVRVLFSSGLFNTASTKYKIPLTDMVGAVEMPNVSQTELK